MIVDCMMYLSIIQPMAIYQVNVKSIIFSIYLIKYKIDILEILTIYFAIELRTFAPFGIGFILRRAFLCINVVVLNYDLFFVPTGQEYKAVRD